MTRAATVTQPCCMEGQVEWLAGAEAEEQLLCDMSADFQALTRDWLARLAYAEELREWDETLLDGLEEAARPPEIAPHRSSPPPP
jgi:hypothetical protein